jgi:hypothetical protein
LRRDVAVDHFSIKPRVKELRVCCRLAISAASGARKVQRDARTRHLIVTFSHSGCHAQSVESGHQSILFLIARLLSAVDVDGHSITRCGG